MKKTKLQEEQEIDDVNHWLELFACDPLLNNSSIPSSPAEYVIRDTKLETCLFEYLSCVVPTLLDEININGFLKYNTNVAEFKRQICGKFEAFICGGETEDGIKGLAATYSKPKKFCGKVFNVGDLTYTCKSCAQDPTCVFCHFCFHQSIHKTHRYKLHTSNGTGGYCDCGDEEAWTTGPACDYHQDGMDNDETWNPFLSLPKDIQCRAAFLFLFVLQYCMELLVLEGDEDEEEINLPIDTSKQVSDNSHIVMLYNDESHSYEDVISTLMEAIKCSRQQAFQFAAVVDKEGRSSIYTGDVLSCCQVAEDCTRLTEKKGKLPLKCKSMCRNIVAHQVVALDLMVWMTEIIEISDGLRRLMCLLTTSKVSGVHYDWSKSFLETVIMHDTSLWKIARARSHQLFMNNILMDVHGRKEFAITFAKCYTELIEDFIVDDHEHDISVAALSVQIFTVPSLATMLILEGNILKTCMVVFLKKLQLAKGSKGSLDFAENTAALNISRVNFILNDVLYLLRQKPVWTPQFSTNFLDAFDVFVDILKLMQGMDPVVRKVQDHIQYEPNWDTAFTLQLGIMPVIRLMLLWCCNDSDILKSATHRCVFALSTLQPMKYTTVKKKIVINHDVSTKSTSIHFALSRFLAGLLAGSSKFGLSLFELLRIERNPDELMTKQQLQLLEYPLRSLVLSAQVNAQMWKRNGYAIHNQVSCYHNVRFVSEMSDRDVLTLQIVACVMDQDHFVKALLHKYNLMNWRKGKDEKEKDKETVGRESVIAREFLLLIFHILYERYVAGVGMLTATEILEREIMHRLCLGPMSRSMLIKSLPFKDFEEEEDCLFESMIDDVLKDVALYREPGVTGKGVFELKEDALEKCNRYFIHFTKSEQSKMVEEKRRIIKKQAKEPSSYLYPPPKFHKNFQDIVKLVCCDSLLKVIRTVLMRTIKEDHGSEEHIEIVLLIIAVGLIEVKRFRDDPSLTDFNFVDRLTEEIGSKKSILNLLDELLNGNDSKEYHSKGKWVRQLLQDEVEHCGVTNMEVDSEQAEMVSVSKGDEAAEKAEKSRIASEHKKKMMEQINQMQKAFIKNNSKLFDIYDIESEDGIDVMEEDVSYPVAIGGRHSTVDNTCMSVLCILCQEEEPIGGENFFVVTSFIHKSRLIKTTNDKERDFLMPELSKTNMVNVSSCGHVVHVQCWEKYYSSVKGRESLPSFQRRPRSTIDVTQTEYLCPLCNSLCNSVLPLLPKATFTECPVDNSSQDMSIGEFLTYLARFSVEMMCSPKSSSGINSAPLSHASDVLSDGSSWTSLFAIYTRGSASSTENSMELFAKRLMKVFSTDLGSRSVSYAVPYSWMACSFTLQTYECCTRIEGNNVFSTFSERQDKFWYALIQYLANNCNLAVYEPVQNFGNMLFNFFCGADSDTSLSILEADIFGILVSLRFLMCCIQNIFQEEQPKLMNTSTWLIDDIVFKICLVAILVKIYLTAPLFAAENDSDLSVEDDVVKSWIYIQNLANINHTSHIDGHKLKQHVLETLLPFMRCSAIFFHYLTGVKFPDNLTLDVVDEEMKTLQKYLNLSEDTNKLLSLEMLTSEPLVNQMIERWCKHKDVFHQKQCLTVTPYCYVQARRLIPLPKDYSSLINQVSGFMCPTLVNDSSRIPALCLVCNAILCSQCYCCVNEEGTQGSRGYGACSKHSMECGSGIGIFLRIRDCEIVLMHNQNKGLFLSSPYLDEYGETDRGLYRGNPLYLNEGRYKNLQQLWLRQRIPEAIAQAMESKQFHLLPSASVVTHWHQL